MGKSQTDKRSFCEESKQLKAATREKERQVAAREEAQARARLESADELGVTGEFFCIELSTIKFVDKYLILL